MNLNLLVKVKSLVITKTYNKLLNKDKKQLVFAPSSLILTNYFLPVNRALNCMEGNYAPPRSNGRRYFRCL